MKLRYKTILFDLDGTLLDSLGDLAAAVNFIMKKNGYPTHTEDAVRTFVGDGIRMLVARALPHGTTETETSRITAEFTAYYGAHMAERTAPYDGILPLLDLLSAAGATLGVVSNKADFAACALVKHYFGDRIAVTVGERAGLAKKPAPDMVQFAMTAAGGTVSDTVYVGDAETDIAVAAAAGIPCISVTWGNRDRAYLATVGATTFADTPAALATLLTEEER